MSTKLGRPALPAGEGKTSRITFRLNPAQRLWVDARGGSEFVTALIEADRTGVIRLPFPATSQEIARVADLAKDHPPVTKAKPLINERPDWGRVDNA